MTQVIEKPAYIAKAVDRAFYIMDYRCGWIMMRDGIRYSQCTSEGQRDGWIASNEYDTGLKGMGVRE